VRRRSPWQILLIPFDFQLSTVDCRLPFLYASSVFSKPRQVESETEIYEAAVRALMFRAFFVRERFSLLLCGVVASVIPAEGADYVRA
jgi:hypothetical protein